MFSLVETFDWSATPLGAMDTWQEALRAVVRTILASCVPMCLIVGEHGILIYNEGYAGISGNRHPAILGMGAVEAWPEAADFNRDVIRRGLGGESFTFDNLHLTLFRNGNEGEEVWLDLSYSPVPDEDGRPLASDRHWLVVRAAGSSQDAYARETSGHSDGTIVVAVPAADSWDLALVVPGRRSAVVRGIAVTDDEITDVDVAVP